jgi:iron-sulfur cluster repair protein YtfE (RIC family)
VDNIDSLIEEHATLRRLAGEVEKAIGTQHGVGWDDQTSCEMPAFCAAQSRFQTELKKHEAKEDRVIDEMLQGREAEREQLEQAIRRAHVSLDGMTALLRTLSGVCDGTHVYAVRTMAERLHEELESHLTYEEKVLFPLLRRRGAARLHK